MNETKSLLVRAEKYLDSAKLLFKNEDYESCVSRIYYAMFFSTQAILLTKKLSYSSHKGVLSAFGQHFIKTGIFPKEMSKQLNLAFEKRQLGDYGHTFVICEEEAEDLLDAGLSFVNTVIQYIEKRGKRRSKKKSTEVLFKDPGIEPVNPDKL